MNVSGIESDHQTTKIQSASSEEGSEFNNNLRSTPAEKSEDSETEINRDTNSKSNIKDDYNSSGSYQTTTLINTNSNTKGAKGSFGIMAEEDYRLFGSGADMPIARD